MNTYRLAYAGMLIGWTWERTDRFTANQKRGALAAIRAALGKMTSPHHSSSEPAKVSASTNGMFWALLP